MANSSRKLNPCCTPRADGAPINTEQTTVIEQGEAAFDLSTIPGGIALVGTDHPFIAIDEESPSRTQEMRPFRMMRTAVTNAQFAQFINETKYKTEAERIGWSFVFYQQLPTGFNQTQAAVNSEWWRKVNGACWNHIGGPDAHIALNDDHPVVHVSWNDAMAFAQWAGGRLPTEAEWEHAARGGLDDVLFPWGNQEPDDNHFHPCNIWQGKFPTTNTCCDGYSATAPAKSYEPNGYGLYNMCGNVWEWSSGRLKIKGTSTAARQHAKHFKGTKLLKGGSYLCHKSYCFRYRIAARTGSTPDSTTTHQGFRLAFDI